MLLSTFRTVRGINMSLYWPSPPGDWVAVEKYLTLSSLSVRWPSNSDWPAPYFEANQTQPVHQSCCFGRILYHSQSPFMGRWPHALPRWLWRDSGFRYSLLPKWLPPPAADAAAPQQEDNGHLPVVGAEGMQCNSEVPRWAYPPVLQLWNRAQKWHFQYQRLQVDIAQRGSLCRTAEARVIYISRLRQEEQPLVTIYQECTRGLLKLHWSILQTNTEFRPHVYAVQQPFPPPPSPQHHQQILQLLSP